MKNPLTRNLGFALKKHSQLHTKPQLLHNSIDLTSTTSLHTKLIKSGFLNDTFITNHLINSYVRFKKPNIAQNLFDEMSEPNVVSWTSLMSGYIHTAQPKVTIFLFLQMHKTSVFPNVFTFATVINACSVDADIETGKKIHAHVELLGFQSNLVVCSSLVDMYGKCNHVDVSRKVFDSMACKNIVSWTSLITAYAQNARSNEALDVFREFNRLTTERPNQFMLASVVNACASLGKLVSGKVAHGAVIRFGYDSNDVVSSSLLDMYAKCGCITYSSKVFRRIRNSTVMSYTSMIVAFAKHGLGRLSLQLFDEMISKGIKPNDVTFVGVLHACSHSGLVFEGFDHLNSMYSQHGITPDAKHYTCVVDMLGRTNRLDEAYTLAKSIEVSAEQGALLWGTLLSSSRLQGRVDIAVEASKKLIESNQQVASAYVTMANVYAFAGEWDNARSLRSEMKRNGVYKEPGCSWVEIKDSSYVFYAGDVSSCKRGGEVVALLRDVEAKMKGRGFGHGKGGNGLVFVDVEDETKEEIIGLHSERLALGFALLSVPKGMTITIMKNLRMCRDCHDFFKITSEMMERDFVVRDVNRFHHFTNGSCTCNDFW